MAISLQLFNDGFLLLTAEAPLISHQSCHGFHGSHLVSVFRCGTTLLPRQLRSGLTPACGSTGQLTSSGSWVRTSLSGPAGEWPLTSLPDICCSSQEWLPCPWSAVMVVSFAAPVCVFSRNHLFFLFSLHCDPVTAWGMLPWAFK